jgi:hypothetical protein
MFVAGKRDGTNFMPFDPLLGGGEKTYDCGRVWNLTRESLIQREKDSAECACGRELIKWNGAHHWIAKLVKDVEEGRK